MRLSRRQFLVSATVAGMCVTIVSSGAAQSGPAAKHLGLVRARFSGTKAYETVAYLDRFVRWPGNVGFDSSHAFNSW